MTDTKKGREQAGLKTHAAVFGNGKSARFATYGELGNYVRDFAYGDIISRPGLDLKTREMLTVAMLTVLGHEHELRIHMKGALNVGVTVEELDEIIIHSVPYNGFPTAINAKLILNELVSEMAE